MNNLLSPPETTLALNRTGANGKPAAVVDSAPLRDGADSGVPFDRILVPVTLSRSSHASLAVARNLARESGARILLLHVVQLNIAGEERGIHRTRLLNELRREAETELNQLAECLGGPVDTEVIVSGGRPAEIIVEAAQRLGADAIIMSTHGYSGWLKWFHHNTALNVTRQAPCGVWLVSPGKRDGFVNLAIVGRNSSGRYRGHAARDKGANPFCAVLRVLFP